jgi:purine-nucleoside phosphorylase
LEAAASKARELNLRYNVGNILSSDTFYSDLGEKQTQAWQKMGVLAVEMEAAGLYMTASRLGKSALAICTISDNIITGEATTAKERQTSFTDMMTLALEVAISI